MNEPKTRVGATEAALQGEGDAGDVARACVLSGEIRAPGTLFDVVSFLAHASWWGELVVVDGETMRSLYFDEGHIVGAESNAESERLAEVLCRHGALTREQADASSGRAEERNLRFGEAVVELGHMTSEQLFERMPRQVEDIVVGMGGVERGQFVFLEGFDDRHLAFRQKRSADGLLLEALRRIDEKRIYRSCIPSDDHVPIRSVGVPPPEEDPFGVYEAIDGKRSVAEVAASIGLAELDVTRALAHHVRTGHAAIKPPRPDAWRMIEIYNEAIAMLLHEVDAAGVGDAVRAQLAAFASPDSTKAFFAPPAADGIVDAGATIERVTRASDPRLAEEQLGQWLYDYASYAIFLARPHLDRHENGQAAPGAPVSGRVAELLAPIRPMGEPTLAPAPSSGPASAPSSRETMRLGSAAATQRMRKVAPTLVPGVNPSRTVQMNAFSVAAARGGRTARTPAWRLPTGAPVGAMRPAFVMPASRRAPERFAEAAPVPAPMPVPAAVPARARGMRTPVVVVVAIACLVLGLVVGVGSRLATHAPAVSASSTSAPPSGAQ